MREIDFDFAAGVAGIMTLAILVVAGIARVIQWARKGQKS